MHYGSTEHVRTLIRANLDLNFVHIMRNDRPDSKDKPESACLYSIICYVETSDNKDKLAAYQPMTLNSCNFNRIWLHFCNRDR